MRKINLVFQEVLKFVLIFLLSFVWLRYFIRKLWLAVLLSFLLSAAVYATLFFIRHRKQAKLGLKLKEKEDAENMFLSLACEYEPMDFFVKLAQKKHENVSKHKNYIVIKHNIAPSTPHLRHSERSCVAKQPTLTDLPDGCPESPNIQHNQQKDNTNLSKATVKTILYADLSFEGLTIPRFMQIYNQVKKEKATKIVIVCKTIADKQLSAFCANFDEKFLIFDEYQTYQKLYKFYDCFPKITKKYKGEKRLAFKEFVAYSFNKKRTKGYLFSAFILIISGIFIRTTVYYCIIASLLVVFALISQFNSYFNTKGETEVL